MPKIWQTCASLAAYFAVCPALPALAQTMTAKTAPPASLSDADVPTHGAWGDGTYAKPVNDTGERGFAAVDSFRYAVGR